MSFVLHYVILVTCREGTVQCRGGALAPCIYSSSICNGRSDCGDGSDEENCNTGKKSCCTGLTALYCLTNIHERSDVQLHLKPM